MVKDKISNAGLYKNLSENISKGIDFILSNDLVNMPCGKYPIDGEKVFINIEEYKTKPMAFDAWESHRKYIDIQIILKGEEIIGITDVDLLNVVDDFKDGGDIAFYEGDDGDFQEVRAGEMLIIYPHEAHMPCRSIEQDDPVNVKKAVIKVLI